MDNLLWKIFVDAHAVPVVAASAGLKAVGAGGRAEKC